MTDDDEPTWPYHYKTPDTKYPRRGDTSIGARRYFRKRYGGPKSKDGKWRKSRWSIAYATAMGRPERLVRLLQRLLQYRQGSDSKYHHKIDMICEAVWLQIGKRDSGRRQKRKKQKLPKVNRSQEAMNSAAKDLLKAKQKWRNENPGTRNVASKIVKTLLDQIMPNYKATLSDNDATREAIKNTVKRGKRKPKTPAPLLTRHK